ncbi:MAG: NAD-dependent epimerase/dehydratase family protein [Smithellaceae bacterium]
MKKLDLSIIKHKKVLLVGGTGFIGRHILARLLELGAEVTVMALFSPGEYEGELLNKCKIIKGDVTQPVNRKVISETNWNIVINVGGFINQRQDAQSDIETFAGHLLHVRELVSILPNNIERFVHAGSAVEYGDNPVPHREDMRERPLTPYAAAKVAATHYLQMLYRSNDFPAVILRPFYIYGPGQDKDKFLPWAIEQANLGRDITMTKGEQTRDPINVTEVAEAFLRASVEKSAIGEVINVASGRPATMADIANLITTTIGKGNVRLGVLPYRRGEIMRSEADIIKCGNILGFFSSISLRNGIRELVLGDAIK